MILEKLQIIFRVTPFHKNIARSILKTPKFYFYDLAAITTKNEGARFENAVALSLLKDLHLRQDTEGKDVGLYYLRNKQGSETGN